MIQLHLLLFAFLFIWGSLSGQNADIVRADSIVFPVHREHVGEIAFMAKPIPLDQFTQNEFLTSFVLKEKTDLNIRVFLANSLTNYLHRLSPELSADELNEMGNYQFTFWVDDGKIYAENLHPGAGTTESKKHKTVFRVPFISASGEDSWGRFLWNRFLMHGGEEALSAGEHRLRVEIRPYLQAGEFITGDVIAAGQITIVVPVKNISEKRIAVQDTKPLRDWQLFPGALDTVKIEQMNRKIQSHIYKDITSVVVIREGKVWLEEYFNGAGRNTLHDTRSVGKSFASALLGMAVQDSFIQNEQQTLEAFYNLKNFPNYTPAKDSITLQNLLTMSSAFAGSDKDPDSPGHEEKMYPSQNWVRFALSLPLDSSKSNGKKWDYFTAGVVVLGDILHKSLPGGLEKYADENLFRPLGIKKYRWQYTPQKVANTAGGLRMRALDLAKFGQLYQNGGIWNGVRIFSEEWAAKTLSRQIAITENEHYGYLFWNKTYTVDGKEYEVYYASGNGGNKIFIFKDQPVVVVITSAAYNTPYGHSQTDALMIHHLIPMLSE